METLIAALARRGGVISNRKSKLIDQGRKKSGSSTIRYGRRSLESAFGGGSKNGNHGWMQRGQRRKQRSAAVGNAPAAAAPLCRTLRSRLKPFILPTRCGWCFAHSRTPKNLRKPRKSSRIVVKMNTDSQDKSQFTPRLKTPAFANSSDPCLSVVVLPFFGSKGSKEQQRRAKPRE